LLPEWPRRDRELWLDAIAPAHPLDIQHYGQGLATESRATIERAYGRYLTWLDVHELLEPSAPAETRVAPHRVAAYVRDLEALGYSAQSRLLLLSGLRSAMRVLAPSVDTTWIMRPGGVSIASRLQRPRSPIIVPDSAVLYRWGLRLTSEAQHERAGPMRMTSYRDGVIIALLAARPVRVRTLAGLTIGQQLIHASSGWRLVLEPEDMKNRRSLEFSLPGTLKGPLEHYLNVVRPVLMNGSDGQRLWIGQNGLPMTKATISNMIRRRSKKEFGMGIGPHRFRHALATSTTTMDPENSNISAQLLAIGRTMAQKHYDRSSDGVAAARFQDALIRERKRLEHLAQLMFSDPTAELPADDDQDLAIG
jgi:site-specific recombinase XerD